MIEIKLVAVVVESHPQHKLLARSDHMRALFKIMACKATGEMHSFNECHAFNFLLALTEIIEKA